MRKIGVLMMMLMVLPSYAANMCSAQDTVTVILDPSIGGKSYTNNAQQGTWSTVFDYGTVHGIMACLNSNHGKGQGGWVANLTDTDNNDVTKPVVGFERYGKYCWCKMTHPVASRWVFRSDYGSASICASNCAYYCGHDVRIYEAMRAGLFGSVAN